MEYVELVKVRMVMMSHLNDIPTYYATGQTELANNLVGFVRFLTFHYKDTSTEIDADAEYNKYLATKR